MPGRKGRARRSSPIRQPSPPSTSRPQQQRQPATPAPLVANVRPPSAINVHGDRPEEWTIFDQQFSWYAAATNLSAQPERIQIAVFMSSIGAEAVKEFNSLQLSQEQSSSLEGIRSALQARFAPSTNYRFERYQFNKIFQEQGETFDKFLTKIMIRAKKCKFGELLDDLVVDRIIFGVLDDQLRAKLLDLDPLSLDKATALCRNAEACSAQVKVVTADAQNKLSSSPVVAAIDKSGKKQPDQSQPRVFPCKNCATSHQWRKCPAFTNVCPKCKKKGHYESTCRASSTAQQSSAQRATPLNPQPNAAPVVAVQKDSSSVEEFFVHSLSLDDPTLPLDQVLFVNELKVEELRQVPQKPDVWFEELVLPSGDFVPLTLDTAARCNVLPLSVASRFNLPLLPSKVRRILSYSAGQFFLNVLGEISVSAIFRSRPTKVYNLTFLVLAENVAPILGFRSCVDCGFVRRVHELSSNSWRLIKDEFSLLFSGLGFAPDYPYDIVFVDSPKFSIIPARRIPFHLHEPVKKELDFMESLQVIRKITHPTPSVSPLVLIKKGGKLKLGLDPSELNKYIKRHHHPLKTAEDIAAVVSEANFFTVLDCFKGYWQIPLTKRTQDYLTFSTPWGRYSCLRLPYGIASAPELFQQIMSSLFQDLQNVEVSMDDILIHARTEPELQEHTRIVLQRIQKAGFKLNPQKCVFGATEVKFLGHVFSSAGLKPDPSKIEGITALKTPSSVNELQRFLGSVTYLGKFIPNLSELTQPLRELLKKDVAWLWSPEHDAAFSRLKAILVSEPVLKFYDVNKPVTLSVDSSSHALGAVLLQDGQPVAYSTKALSSSQQLLPQIEKEALAVRFACSKFHQYVYGKLLTVETDHKPLESIFKKSVYMAPPRLKRILLDVLPYNPSVVYKKGKAIPIPDMLSRDCAPISSHPEPELEVLLILPVSPRALQELQEATQTDQELSQLAELIKNGWPETYSKTPFPLRKYFNFREELSLHDQIILKNDLILVPTALRSKYLQLIHQGHLGTTSSINRAKTAVFWPGLSEEITRFVASCAVCQSVHKNKPSEPILLKPIPTRPWETVATDLFQIGSNHFLLIADSYSGYVDYKQLVTLSSSAVIQALKYWFSVHGIPEYLESDGGPQYSSSEFVSFAQQWHFTHRVSSPHFPRSNGLAERNVATVKNILLKCAKDNTDPFLALLNWRNTPRSATLLSPNERLMSRKTRTLLPSSQSSLMPKVVHDVPQALQAAREQQKTYADRAAQSQKPFSVNEPVLVKLSDKHWVPARISEVLPEPRSYVVETTFGQFLRRNSSFLRRSSIPFQRSSPPPMPSVPPAPAQQSPQPPATLAATRTRRTIKPPTRLDL